MLDKYNPDLVKSVGSIFPMLESCTMYWEPRVPILDKYNPDLGRSVDGVFPKLEIYIVYWEPRFQYWINTIQIL